MFRVILLTLLLLILVIFHDWLANHWESLKWPILIGSLILGMIGSSKSERMGAYAERHLEFNRVINENPWMKIFYAVYAVAVVVVVVFLRCVQQHRCCRNRFLGACGAHDPDIHIQT